MSVVCLSVFNQLEIRKSDSGLLISQVFGKPKDKVKRECSVCKASLSAEKYFVKHLSHEVLVSVYLVPCSGS